MGPHTNRASTVWCKDFATAAAFREVAQYARDCGVLAWVRDGGEGEGEGVRKSMLAVRSGAAERMTRFLREQKERRGAAR